MASSIPPKPPRALIRTTRTNREPSAATNPCKARRTAQITQAIHSEPQRGRVRHLAMRQIHTCSQQSMIQRELIISWSCGQWRRSSLSTHNPVAYRVIPADMALLVRFQVLFWQIQLQMKLFLLGTTSSRSASCQYRTSMPRPL